MPLVPLVVPSIICFFSSSITSCVERPGLKPTMLCGNRPFLSMYRDTRLCMACSAVLPTHEVSDIGRMFSGASGLPGFGISMTEASFQTSGTRPVSHALLISSVSFSTDFPSRFLNSLFETPSGPVAERPLRPSKASQISDSVKGASSSSTSAPAYCG